jgi:hypothetical protein
VKIRGAHLTRLGIVVLILSGLFYCASSDGMQEEERVTNPDHTIDAVYVTIAGGGAAGSVIRGGDCATGRLAYDEHTARS